MQKRKVNSEKRYRFTLLAVRISSYDAIGKFGELLEAHTFLALTKLPASIITRYTHAKA